MKIDRKFSGTERALVHQRRCLVNGDANELKLRVILDRFSAEVFINDGEQVMSAVMFTEQEANGISFFADGAAKIDEMCIRDRCTYMWQRIIYINIIYIKCMLR